MYQDKKKPFFAIAQNQIQNRSKDAESPSGTFEIPNHTETKEKPPDALKRLLGAFKTLQRDPSLLYLSLVSKNDQTAAGRANRSRRPKSRSPTRVPIYTQ